MKAAALVGGVFLAAAFLSCAKAADENCKVVRSEGTRILHECGGQIRSFSFEMSDFRWQWRQKPYAASYLACLELQQPAGKRGVFESLGGDVEKLASWCPEEPAIRLFFLSPTELHGGPKSARDFYEILVSHPVGDALNLNAVPPMPPVACPLFDVSVGDMPGRGVCFDLAEGKDGAVVVVAADERVGLVLTFSREGKGGAAIREKALALIPKFKIERASGDAALLRWMK
jgi:hypothetical protein